jgi:hypothetical protein
VVRRRRGDLEILELHRTTAFAFDEQGRMIHESSPGRTLGRRFSFAGCREGNVAVVRADVAEAVAHELAQLVASEPPLIDPDAEAAYVDEYLALLGEEGAPAEHQHGLLWVFPDTLAHETRADLVWSGTNDGDRLLQELGDSMPASLLEAGFQTPENLWAPWCIAMVDGKIASIAETVRVGQGGSEVGVDTVVEFRGEGLGAAATAGWSRHPDVAQRVRFYSTGRENLPSRRLAERLGLRFLGSTFAVP